MYSPRQYVRLAAETAAIAASAMPAEVLGAMKQVSFVDAQAEELQMADTAILALRLNEGLDLADFAARFGRRFEDVYAPVLAEATADGMLERANGRIRLTDKGRYLANEVFVRLLPD